MPEVDGDCQKVVNEINIFPLRRPGLDKDGI